MAGPDLNRIGTGEMYKKEDKLANLDHAEHDYLE